MLNEYERWWVVNTFSKIYIDMYSTHFTQKLLVNPQN